MLESEQSAKLMLINIVITCFAGTEAWATQANYRYPGNLAVVNRR
jgi:hypothetical protein